VALRLNDSGADHRMIAMALGVEDDQVPLLLELAETKLAAVLKAPAGGDLDF
jgi:hypothetical protein